PGVVSIPHGWGHGMDGAGLSVAAGHPGVNSNVLADGDLFDPLSGNAVLNGIPVIVERVAAPGPARPGFLRRRRGNAPGDGRAEEDVGIMSSRVRIDDPDERQMWIEGREDRVELAREAGWGTVSWRSVFLGVLTAIGAFAVCVGVAAAILHVI